MWSADTRTGAELTLGYTVFATVRPSRNPARDPAIADPDETGGTGVILAAEMALAAPGAAVAQALRSMSRPQGAAAAVLHPWHMR